MKKLALTVVLLLPLLTGCAFLDFFKKKDDQVIIQPETILVDSENLKLCTPLTRIERPDPSQEELDAIKFIWIEQYGICARRQANSVNIIKKLANIKDSE